MSDKLRTSTDGQLLTRFIRSGDDAAFATLVDRHQMLVMHACQRVLSNSHDVDDAFQLTFVTLAQSASKIHKNQSLASWLYRVAYRMALKTLKERTMRKEQHMLADTASQDNLLDEVAQRHIQQIVDEELHGLPEKYQQPLILFYLSGQTSREIAAELQLSVAAVEGRLRRGLLQLRRRVARRGVALSAMTMAMFAFNERSCVQATAMLVRSTIETSVASVSVACRGVRSALNSAASQTPIRAGLAVVASIGVVGLGLLFSAFDPLDNRLPPVRVVALPQQDESLKPTKVSLTGVRNHQAAQSEDQEVTNPQSDRSKKAIFQGPGGLDEDWQSFDHRAADWIANPQGHLTTTRPSASLFREIELTEKVQIDLKVQWAEFADFKVALGAPPQRRWLGDLIQIETWSDEVVTYHDEGDFEPVVTLDADQRELYLKLFWDQAAEKFFVYDQDDQPLAVLEGIKANFTRCKPGIFIENKEGSLTLALIRASKWDGKLPKP